MGLDFAGCKGTNHADKDSDENTDDQGDDDHELVILMRMVREEDGVTMKGAGG